ncbi:hypothetical protein DL770_010866 [Monosporascus sp. CRB-9-2]|nr:hypothetical protein DL770_010866 [Monosporascus sp. CRB-9-2]
MAWATENEEGDYSGGFRVFIIAVLNDDTVRRTSRLYHFAIAIFTRFISEPGVTQDKRRLYLASVNAEAREAVAEWATERISKMPVEDREAALAL